MGTHAADGEFELSVLITHRSEGEALTIRLPETAVGADLMRVISERRGVQVGVCMARTGRRIEPNDLVLCLGIVDGDELRVIELEDTTQPPSRARRSGGGGLVLTVLKGPSAGLHIPVREPVTIGRQELSGIHGVLGHTTSRMHAEVAPTLVGGQITDLDSKNGTWVNGVRIDRPCLLTAGDRIEIGPNTAIVELDSFPERRFDLPHLSLRCGRLIVNRSPRVIEPSAPDRLALGLVPSRPARRRFPIGAAVAPLILGVALAILWNPLFALFIALSPVMLAFSYIDDRRSGRRDYDEAVSEFQTRLEDCVREAGRRTEQIASHLRKRTPENRQLIWWAHGIAPDVWSRRPADDDFLSVALGDTSTSELLTIEYPSEGDEALLAEARERLDEARPTVRVPVGIDLGVNAVIGFCGDGATSRSIVRTVLAQLATLRSPRDLRLVVLAPDSRNKWAWVKWLPHASSDTNSSFVATTADEAKMAFGSLEDLVSARQAMLESSTGGGRALPHVVLVLEGELPVSPRALSRLLESAGSVGISVLTIGAHRYDVPGEASIVVESTISEDGGSEVVVTTIDGGARVDGIIARKLRLGRAERLARDLAPLVDATGGSDATELPQLVTLDEAVGGEDDLLERIQGAWANHDDGLRAVIGIDARGPRALDLRADGPHALVAGTTGSGKSELLQTLVASLASAYPPERLNFILIDYKGGAAFARCGDLPHTVGSVTNLDERLAERALVSLQAELRRRERILSAHDAKDLATLEAQNPAVAPPSLVLVIDEFAALRNEVPDFVDGIVDIAQRGRSMGVHLVLATQKPGGVITPQIEANTNLRVALRVANESESRDVLGTTAAAAIDRRLPGRAIIRIGTDEGVPVQTAWVGRRAFAATSPAASARPLRTPSPRQSGRQDLDSPTDLDRLVDVIRLASAGRSSNGPAVHRPWIEELAGIVPIADIIERQPVGDPAIIPLALADEPESQSQSVWSVDLASGGNAAIFGGPGSGKTTTLRTVAAATATSWGPESAVLYAIDATNGGLRAISELAMTAEVVDGNDIGRVQLLFEVIRRDLESRRVKMAELGVDSHTAWRRLDPAGAPPVTLLLIDGFDSLWAAVEMIDGGRFGAEMIELFSAGRSAGIHVVWTARQRSTIPAAVVATAGARLVQRLTSDDEYGWFGLSLGDRPIPAGRTFLSDGLEMQIAVACPPGGARMARASNGFFAPGAKKPRSGSGGCRCLR